MLYKTTSIGASIAFKYLIASLIEKSSGRVVVIGLGKSGHIGRKIAATMASIGVPAIYLHPAECLHGDLGMIMKDDVVICYIESNEALRVDRMYHRGDSTEQVQKRIKNDEIVFGKDALVHIDKIFVNENKSLDDLALEIYEYYKETINNGGKNGK